MRLMKLELLAYGHFRGLTLDFSSPGIHVVIGRNEAGKSTTLRAITGLFYGIDRYTADAFLHPMKELRIGGVIEGSNGERVRVIRRKGAVNTLLDAQGQPIDETVMKRLLNGVSEETFRNAFGLDHDALEAGAKGLLEGGGDLGESLFDASVGGGGGEVQRLLADLSNEADKIYRPRGTALPLNDALKSFADAQKTVREKQSLPEAFLTQERGLEEITRDRAVKLQRKGELVAKKERIARGRKRLPLERKKERAIERRVALGRLADPDAILRIDGLRERFHAYLHAADLRRTLARDVERLADRIAEAARRAGLDPSSKTTNLEGLRLDAKKEARIHALLGERGKLLDRLERSRDEISRLEREQARLRDEIAAMTPPQPPKRAPSRASSKQASLFDDNDAPLILARTKKHSETVAANDDDHGTALHVALDRAKLLGDIETRVATQHGQHERQKKKLESRVAALGLFEGPLSSFVKLRLPAAASVERLEHQAAEVGRTLALLQERGADLDREEAAIEKQMAIHAGDFAPPDEATLAKARDERDQALAKATRFDGEVERLVREVDTIADRMIHEAERVTTIARLKSEAEVNARQRERLQRDKTKALEERAAIDAEYHQLFAESKIAPLGFAEMAQWLDRHVQIVDANELLREGIAALVDEENKVVRAKAELISALAMIKDSEKLDESTPLSELIAIGTRKLAAIDAARQRAEEASRNLQKVRDELAERTIERDRDLDTLTDVKRRLDELLRPIGVAADAASEEVTRSIEALRDLFALADTRDDTEARARNAEADVRAFEGDLLRAVKDLAPDLSTEVGHTDEDARDLGPLLFNRGAEASKNAQELAHLEEQLEAEGNVSFASEDERLLASDHDAALRAEEDLAEEIEDIEREVSHLTERIGAGRLGLEQMRAESNAADAAADAQRALARVKDHVSRWCRARLASVLLSREIERYREENQAPLLLSTSSFFSRLTLESFTGVRAGFDDKDKPCLRCVRADGQEVDIGGLSDGTRDQLYLSLRLSSLLRRAEVAEPMPLILDDVLIQLDDQRAAAALSVLSDVSKKMQILFFTHHARLVDLARSAIDQGLVVHELEGRSGEIAASP